MNCEPTRAADLSPLALLANVIACAAIGCATASSGKSDAVPRGGGEAVVVLGAPGHSTVWIYEQVDDGANGACAGSLRPAARASARDGFVIARLPARTGNERYVLAEMAPRPEASEGLRPTQNAKVPAFSVAPGRVTFVGGVNLLGLGRGLDLVPDPSSTTARATRYLARSRRDATGPTVQGPMVQGKMDWITLPSSCMKL